MTRKHYFIFSLPRSRSTWVAHALCYGKSVCYHDLTAEGDMDYIEHTLQDSGFEFSGMADTGIIHRIPEMTRFSSCPAIALHRDHHQCEKSTLAAGYKIPHKFYVDGDYWLQNLHEYWEGPVLHVNYDDIDTAGSAIWEHCIGSGFNSGWWEYLCNLKIEVNIPRVLQSLPRDKRELIMSKQV